jgi:hypothetical protein
MKLQRYLEGRTLSADCSEDLRQQGESVLDTLTELDRRGPRLHDGTRIRFGWSMFTLRAEGETLVVCEPEFNGDPFRNFVAGINTTLRVLRGQSALLHIVHVPGIDTNFDDKIVLQRDSLQTERIYLERKPVRQSGDSGWYIGPTDPNARNEDFEAIYVYKLLSARAALLNVLALPWDYLSMFRGDQLEAVVNEKNQEIWRYQNQGK